MLTRSEWDADDLVQETLVKLFALGRKTQPPLSKAYVFRTATNAWIDICRKKKLIVQEWQDELDAPVQEADPLDIEDSLELLLDSLPVGQATVLLLVDVFQFTAKETADMVNSTEGAVKAMLHRARTGMRKKGRLRRAESYSRIKDDVRPMSTSQKQTAPQPLIARFLEAFRRSDPYVISLAYMDIQRNDIEVTHEEPRGVLCFRFRDPEGNVCVVESESFLAS